MTTDAKTLFSEGGLAAAIEAQMALVRQRATDADARAFLTDLLCFAGDFERADKQLDVIASQRTDLAVPVALSRQLVRAAVARRDVFEKGRPPELLAGADGTIQASLRVLLDVRQGAAAAAAAAAAELEASHPRLRGTCDGAAFDDVRDADDVTARVLEVLTSTGKYYWVPLSSIGLLEFRKPERARDLLWRRAHIEVRGGPDGEVYVPAIYPLAPDAGAANADALRLGRETDWRGRDGEPARGIGQRVFLVGDEGRPINEIGTLAFAAPAAAG
ncbi:MAG: SciE type virulence protein [Alphaproteobacteria bacterium]|nr:SciE type virulence protein [Alphaproteobacteria bacterium]